MFESSDLRMTEWSVKSSTRAPVVTEPSVEADASASPHTTAANQSPGPHYGRSTPPKDYKVGIYNSRLVEIQDDWNAFEEYFVTVPTLDGEPAVIVRPWIPWFAPDQANLSFVALILNYMPLALFFVFGYLHPAAALDDDGALISATWELLRLSLGSYYWLCIKFNVIPYAYPYGGKPTDKYSRINYVKIMTRYSQFLMKVFLKADKTVLCSKDVRKRVKRFVFGGNENKLNKVCIIVIDFVTSYMCLMCRSY